MAASIGDVPDPSSAPKTLLPMSPPKLNLLRVCVWIAPSWENGIRRHEEERRAACSSAHVPE
jgi:hypothetical protein